MEKICIMVTETSHEPGIGMSHVLGTTGTTTTNKDDSKHLYCKIGRPSPDINGCMAAA